MLTFRFVAHAADNDQVLEVVTPVARTRPPTRRRPLPNAVTTIAARQRFAATRTDRLRAEHGRSEEGRAGVLLTKAGRTAILDGHERRMLSTTRGALPGFAGSLRRHTLGPRHGPDSRRVRCPDSPAGSTPVAVRRLLGRTIVVGQATMQPASLYWAVM